MESNNLSKPIVICHSHELSQNEIETLKRVFSKVRPWMSNYDANHRVHDLVSAKSGAKELLLVDVRKSNASAWLNKQDHSTFEIIVVAPPGGVPKLTRELSNLHAAGMLREINTTWQNVESLLRSVIHIGRECSKCCICI